MNALVQEVVRRTENKKHLSGLDAAMAVVDDGLERRFLSTLLSCVSKRIVGEGVDGVERDVRLGRGREHRLERSTGLIPYLDESWDVELTEDILV